MIKTGFIEILDKEFDDIHRGWVSGAEATMPSYALDIEYFEWGVGGDDKVVFICESHGSSHIYAGWLRYVVEDRLTTLATPNERDPKVTITSAKHGYIFLEDTDYEVNLVRSFVDDYLAGRVSRLFLRNLEYFAVHDRTVEEINFSISRAEAETQAREHGVGTALLDGAL